MVTHDPRSARLAHRTVYLFDGRVLDEQALTMPRGWAAERAGQPQRAS